MEALEEGNTDCCHGDTIKAEIREISSETYSLDDASIAEYPKSIFRTFSSSLYRSLLSLLPEKKNFSRCQTLLMSYQTLGVVYGDLGTSSLYVFSPTNIKHPEENDILGILSLIFWTLTSIGLIKYAFIVLQADDHGEGGTFALYSLLCRHINVGNNTISSQLSYGVASNTSFTRTRREGIVDRMAKRLLEKNHIVQKVLIIFVMIGTSMVIGDGVLTPAISVLSAVQGIQSRNPKMSTDVVVIISAIILILLFLMQKYGTSKVSFVFSPIMVAWFVSTAIIGVYNICAHYPKVFKGLSPHYIFHFFAKSQKVGWTMLGAVFLSITGLEAMFADLGHFSKASLQIGFTMMVYPALVVTYAGQAAYLIKHPEDIGDAFYKSTPQFFFWPMFVISTLASIVTSQAMITATFSIVKQSVALGCFPRVEIVHTSKNQEGQIYCPEVNYVIMILCLTVLLGFRSQEQIGNAYGVVVIWVMIMTTFLVSLVMIVIWRSHLLLILAFFSIFGFIEGVFMTAAMNKMSRGGWVPFGISALFSIIMLTWYYGRQKKHGYEMENKISFGALSALLANSEISRPPGICFFYTNFMEGLPPILLHYVKTVRSLHQIVILVTIRLIPVKTVPPEDRFVGGKLGPRGVYRCVVQYGYTDVLCMQGEDFVKRVIESLKAHIKVLELQSPEVDILPRIESSQEIHIHNNGEYIEAKIFCGSFSRRHELEVIEWARKSEVVFLLGRSILRTSKDSTWIEHLLIDKLYRFLENNSRSAVATLNIPPAQFLQVEMFYRL